MFTCFGFFKEKGTVIHSHENGCSDSPSLPYSEKAVQNVLEKPVHGIDENLPEFSEALRTVAKALRLAAEGKASAQAEAAEWKRKFEQEKARNSQQGCKGLVSENHSANVPSERASETQTPNKSEVSPLGNEHCCGENEICNHEVLQDGELASNLELVKRRFLRKASFRLSWNDSKKGNRYKHDVVSFERGNIGTTERSSKQISLKWESQPQSVLVLTKPSSTSVRLLCSELVRWLKEQKNLNIYVEPRVRSELLDESSFYNFVQTWKDDTEVLLLHKKVDFVVTLGGDGTVLWTASLFKGPVPPVVPFNMGSLGFMTPFHSESYKESLDAVLQGPVSITLRHRLKCSILRATAKDDSETVEPYYVLNEVTIDRGVSPYLTNLKCYFDDIYVTCVQGDGLILATTSGSTAYSLAAGGSMVHPQVPGILFTPISPHSLSFRPLILPEHVTLRMEVPTTSRGPAWVSFDGKGRTQLAPGDALKCSMAPWPVPTACPGDSMVDFLKSIQEGLHWNVRKTQACDAPSDLST